MNNLDNTLNLTNKEIKLIAFEAEGVNHFDPYVLDNFSHRTQGFILKAGGSISYTIGRCYFLINRRKLNN